MLAHAQSCAGRALCWMFALAALTGCAPPAGSTLPPASSATPPAAATTSAPLLPTIASSVTPLPPPAASATPIVQATEGPLLLGARWEEAATLIDRRVPELLAEFAVPGAAVALVQNGEPVWVQGYGLADIETRRPVEANTVFQVASISKTVTAWGVMRLVAAGKLDLDAPVERYLTRWQLPPSAFDHDGVTIRRVLSHTAGLSLGGYPGIPPDQPLPTLEESLGGGHPGAGEVRVMSEPGTTWSYSGGGYTLLQLVVEEVAGESFADYMRREVLEPLGMLQSSYTWDTALRPATATGYSPEGRAYPNFLFVEHGPAGLYSTAADVARFAAASLPGPNGEPAGRGVLPPELLAAMIVPAPGTEEDSYGLGYQMNVFGPGLVGHAGANQGWKTFFGVIPATGEGIVVLANGDSGRQLRAALVEELYALAGRNR